MRNVAINLAAEYVKGLYKMVPLVKRFDHVWPVSDQLKVRFKVRWSGTIEVEDTIFESLQVNSIIITNAITYLYLTRYHLFSFESIQYFPVHVYIGWLSF